MRPSDRDYDLTVWGATGYTGRLVAEALAAHAPAGFRWAIGGRDAMRLDGLLAELANARTPPSGTFVGDALDDASMRALANSSRVILTTVGPYARYGTPLVRACAETGTHYADLTAELGWMRSNVDAFHDVASSSGARIVHASGFDSVPSDLGAWLVQQEALARHGEPCTTVVHAVGAMSGGVSGGTIHSGLGMADQAARDPAFRQALRDPNLLAPGGTPANDPVGPVKPTRLPHVEGWTAPFVMAVANGKVVRRTRHLLGEPWADVTYVERLVQPTWARAATLASITAMAGLTLGTSLGRAIAHRVLPSQGQGPSERTRTRGFFRTRLIGRSAGHEPIVVDTGADLDPGYGATALMLAAMGLTLALEDGSPDGGVLTPAVAGGDAYLARVGAMGVTIRVAEG